VAIDEENGLYLYKNLEKMNLKVFSLKIWSKFEVIDMFALMRMLQNAYKNQNITCNPPNGKKFISPNKYININSYMHI
jgi:hypothetical protein